MIRRSGYTGNKVRSSQAAVAGDGSRDTLPRFQQVGRHFLLYSVLGY